MRQNHNKQNQEEGHYWISISDLMTSLLFIFILILAYTIFTFNEQSTILEEKTKVFEESFFNRGELLTQIQSTLQKDNINVDIDPENGNLRLQTDGYFAIGSADLSPKGKETMAQIAKVIREKLQENPKFHQAIDTVFIEGHTDNTPIHSNASIYRRWTNMELSAQRAINTFLIMDETVHISEMKNHCGRNLFSYSGYADQRPVATNNTEEGRNRNRRIEIFFALSSPQISTIKNCHYSLEENNDE